MAEQTTFTYELDAARQAKLLALLAAGNFVPREVPYARAAVAGEGFNCALYEKERHGKRKLCVQGAKAKEFVEFRLEPEVLGEAALGYEAVLHPENLAPHAGSDESGKGDYFGPLVTCCCYADGELAAQMRELGAKDCKQMTDGAILSVGANLRALLGPNRFAVVRLNPPAYNRLYAKMRNVNRMLAWAHGAAIEELLGKRPGCGRVVVDQFAPTEDTILRALKPLGRAAEIVQRHRAEDDVAVAAASVIAREIFLRALMDSRAEYGLPAAAEGDGTAGLPKGSSDPRIAELAAECVRRTEPKWLMNHCKAHFRTTDRVLAACGFTRGDLPPEGRVASALERKLADGIAGGGEDGRT